MALSPEDILAKRFQVTKFREGYDQDEVDDYLDEIVVELRKILSENQDLKTQGSPAGEVEVEDFPV
ncbi:MAG: DivIVA domain-containing protein, partial [Aquiluna sp.]